MYKRQRVVLAVTLAPRFGIQFVWMAVPMGWLVNYLISFFQFRTGKWAKLHNCLLYTSRCV